MKKTIKERYINYSIILILIAISSVIIFNNLGASSFIDWDESIYANNALEILKTGNWIVLKEDSKPPLGAWLIAISFKIFGITTFALRFWSAISAIGIVVIVYLFGKEIANKTTGIISALFLLIIPSFVGLKALDLFTHGARSGNYDILLTFFITLSLFLFYLYEKRQKTGLLIASSASMALAVLTKGIIGFFPIVIIGIYLLYSRSFKKFINKKTLYAVLTFFIIILPWFIFRFIQGKDFFSRNILYSIISLTQAREPHIHEWYYYFSFLTRIFNLLLLILLIVAFIYAIYLMKKKDKTSSLLVIWVSLILLVFTIARTKIRWYIIPIYPALSLLVGNFFNGLYKYFKIKKIILLIIFILIIFSSFLNIVNLTNKVYKSEEQKTLEYLKEDLKDIDILYVNEEENGEMAILFLLNYYIKGKVIVYYDSEEPILQENDYLISFTEHRFGIIDDSKCCELIKERNNIALFKKT